jgi:hypothetical protein
LIINNVTEFFPFKKKAANIEQMGMVFRYEGGGQKPKKSHYVICEWFIKRNKLNIAISFKGQKLHTTCDQNRPVYRHISATFVNRDFAKVEWNFWIKLSTIECQKIKDSLSKITFW